MPEQRSDESQVAETETEANTAESTAADPGSTAEERPPVQPPAADERLLAAHDLARAALLEITPEPTVGKVVGHVVEGEHVLSLLFECTMSGYPGWRWTVSLARMVGGTAVLLAWSAVTGGLGAVMPRTAEQWAWVGFTGLLLAGYVLSWHQALARALAVDVTAVLVVAAIITALLAGAFTDGPLAQQAPWLAMLAGGGVLVWLAPRRQPVPPKVGVAA